jgi:regulator of replication initiation timing
MKDALSLINSQEQRIEKLAVELEAMRCAANSYKMHNKELTEENERLRARMLEENHLRHQAEEMLVNGMSVVRADTLREFAKRLKDRAVQIPKYNGDVINAQWVDRISSEMLEDTK